MCLQDGNIQGFARYLDACCSPDFSIAVSAFSRQLHIPAERHLELAKSVVRFSVSTVWRSHFFANFIAGSELLMVYAHADFTACQDTGR